MEGCYGTSILQDPHSTTLVIRRRTLCVAPCSSALGQYTRPPRLFFRARSASASCVPGGVCQVK
eukprot:4130479-Prorocentrum_lima.AAC.1